MSMMKATGLTLFSTLLSYPASVENKWNISGDFETFLYFGGQKSILKSGYKSKNKRQD
jgi:hypothetical protein